MFGLLMMMTLRALLSLKQLSAEANMISSVYGVLGVGEGRIIQAGGQLEGKLCKLVANGHRPKSENKYITTHAPSEYYFDDQNKLLAMFSFHNNPSMYLAPVSPSSGRPLCFCCLQ